MCLKRRNRFFFKNIPAGNKIRGLVTDKKEVSMLSATETSRLILETDDPVEIRGIFKEIIFPNSKNLESAREGLQVIFLDLWKNNSCRERKQVELWQLVLKEEFAKAADVQAFRKREEIRSLIHELDSLLVGSLADMDRNMNFLQEKAAGIVERLQEIGELNKILF
jgi:hypothetical protein